jgi:hypothetical protein
MTMKTEEIDRLPCCRTCLFSRAYSESLIRGGPAQTVLRCHAGAPPAVAVTESAPGGPYAEWPQVAPGEWCGDFAPKHEREGEA